MISSIKLKIYLKTILILLFLHSSAWGAVSEYACVTPDGSDPNVGRYAGRAYSTLALWEAGENKDLTAGAGTHHICEIIGDWSGTTDVTTASTVVDGWTTNYSYRVEITVPASVSGGVADSARHAGKYDSTKYVLALTAGANTQAALQISDENVWLDGLQIQINNADFDDIYGILNPTATVDACVQHWQDLIILGGNNTGVGDNVQGIFIGDGSLSLYLWNILVYNIINGTVYCYGIHPSSGNPAIYIYNCTVSDCDNNISSDSNQTYVYNTISYNARIAGREWTGNFAGGSHNASGATDPQCPALPGAADFVTMQVAGADFTDYAVDDFSLDVGANLVGTGTDDPSSGLYNDDIESEARTSVWDIGADEYVAAAPPAGGGDVPTQIMGPIVTQFICDEVYAGSLAYA